jgi:hypothetical protein
VRLAHKEFVAYVMDKWDWQEAWEDTVSNYSAGHRGARR